MTTARLLEAQAQSAPELAVRTLTGSSLNDRLAALAQYVTSGARVALSRHPGWLPILNEGLNQEVLALEAIRNNKTVGYLGLAYVQSWLFGRFLVSLPYLNYGGVLADDPAAGNALMDRAVRLADELGVRYLELRHEWAQEHGALNQSRTDKIHMRLDLPATAGRTWDQLPAKVRNQIRKGQKGNFTVHWGGAELLGEFYEVFSQNMRDLGTPVFGRKLFECILQQFPSRSELCVVRDGTRPVATALVLHGWGVTEIPSASSLRSYNSACVNMLMYWRLLERASERGQEVFDFGRSSENSPTYQFKKQWGATPCPAEWQYHVRRGDIAQLRTNNPKYKRMIAIWRRLPVWVTRQIGPRIVRGIP